MVSNECFLSLLAWMQGSIVIFNSLLMFCGIRELENVNWVFHCLLDKGILFGTLQKYSILLVFL